MIWLAFLVDGKMKIIIVDDDDVRSEKLAEFLVDSKLVSRGDVHISSCTNDAKQVMRNVYFDAMILDVVIPRQRSEGASAAYGLSFLSHVARSPSIKKPEKIIGMTAHLSDISMFRMEFDEYCLSVIEAPANSDEWKPRVVAGLSYTATSKLGRVVDKQKVHALTVHGIRTFGEWQDRLRGIVHAKYAAIPFHNYKYGYFSSISFSVPILRDREVKRLANHLLQLFDGSEGARFVIYCHSFGTYLVANALKLLVSQGYQVPVDTVCLAGSVLPSRYDWGFLFRSANTRIVNDCADKDFVLWCSELIVYGTGMAGKTGFYGISNRRLINRFHRGGHSSYFEGDQFLSACWMPMLDASEEPIPVDERISSILAHDVAEQVVAMVGWGKPYFYLFGFASVLLHFVIG